MNKTNFRGWLDVYKFTFAQTTKKTSFRVVTVIIALCIILGICGYNLVRVLVKDEPKPSPIETVYVIDKSGLKETDYSGLLVAKNKSLFSNVQFKTVSDKTKEEVLKSLADKANKDVVATIELKESSYHLEIALPKNSEISEGEASDLANVMVECFEINKLEISGVSNESLGILMAPVQITTADIGEDTSVAADVIKIALPMVFGFVLYFMLLLHGQTITLEVSTEKTSKLMETLLTTIHPYALIMGKVLAISSVAIMQFIIWALSIFVGLYGGNAIAQTIEPSYSNSVVELINFLRESLGQSAMTLSAIILAVIIFCAGFVFYCMLAGLSGCMVTKPEDTAVFQSIFQMPIIISFFVCYFGTLAGNEQLLLYARYIPFTAPFCVPVGLLTGTIPIWQGLLATILLLLFSLIIIMLSARIYKGLVLYNGQKLSFKKIVSIVRNNTN